MITFEVSFKFYNRKELISARIYLLKHYYNDNFTEWEDSWKGGKMRDWSRNSCVYQVLSMIFKDYQFNVWMKNCRIRITSFLRIDLSWSVHVIILNFFRFVYDSWVVAVIRRNNYNRYLNRWHRLIATFLIIVISAR